MSTGEQGESTWDVEALLGDVLRPIEPPELLSGRIEDTFTALSAAAATELSDWAEELSDSEMRALRDPRNWVRHRGAGPLRASPPRQARGERPEGPRQRRPRPHAVLGRAGAGCLGDG
jgi:hypothetical protein